jgi:hypothetical protein
MAEAQFIPGGGAGNIVGALNSGLGTGMSMMDRVQSMRIRDQQLGLNQAQDDREAERLDMERQKFAVLQPALEVKAKADIAQANATVAGLKQSEEARLKANILYPKAIAEFDAMMDLEEPNMREAAALKWLGQYGHLENIQQFSKEFSSFKNIVGTIHKEATALRALTKRQEGAEALAGIRANNATEIATIRSKYGDKAGVWYEKLQQARADGDTEAIDLYTSLLDKARAGSTNTAYGSAQVFQELEEARKRGDPGPIALWEKRAAMLQPRAGKNPTATIEGILNGLGDAAPAAPAAATKGPTTKPAAAPAPVADPFAKIKF